MKETGLTGKRRSTTIAATPDDGKSQRKRRRRRRCFRAIRVHLVHQKLDINTIGCIIVGHVKPTIKNVCTYCILAGLNNYCI